MVEPSDSARPVSIVGRYAIHAEIAHGGMATIHLGRLTGPGGFSRTLAIKRLHPMFAKDPEFVAMFMDEARLAARIQHPNVVSIIDVVAQAGELLLVMDYIQGESLSRLLRAERQRGGRIDLKIAVKLMSEVLSGLHAAHEVTNERGMPLDLVHRDVSPQNILVGVDGVARLIDFGVAKAAGRAQSTRQGQLKGKLPYMAPEQIKGGTVDRRTDVYAASVVLWELMVGRRLFQGDEANVLYGVLSAPIPAPSTLVPGVSAALEAVVMKGLERNPSRRYSTAMEMADALEAAMAPASSREVARWMKELSSAALDERAKLVAEVESMSHVSLPPAAALALTDMLSDGSASSGTEAPAGEPGAASPPPPAEWGALSTETSATLSSARIMASLRVGRRRRIGMVVAAVLAAGVLPATALLLLRGKPPAEAAPAAADSSSSAPFKDGVGIEAGAMGAVATSSSGAVGAAPSALLPMEREHEVASGASETMGAVSGTAAAPAPASGGRKTQGTRPRPPGSAKAPGKTPATDESPWIRD